MYMITVTKNGKHYFATQKMNKKSTEIGLMYRFFQEKFSEQEGFLINVYKMTVYSNDSTEDIERLVTEEGHIVLNEL